MRYSIEPKVLSSLSPIFVPHSIIIYYYQSYMQLKSRLILAKNMYLMFCASVSSIDIVFCSKFNWCVLSGYGAIFWLGEHIFT